MLHAGFRLPIVYDQSSKHIVYSRANFSLSSIRDELTHSSTFPDVVLQAINKLLVIFHAISIGNESFSAYENLRTLRTIVDGRGVGKNCVSSNRFRSTLRT